jgi:hypothetical protein
VKVVAAFGFAHNNSSSHIALPVAFGSDLCHAELVKIVPYASHALHRG